MARHINLKEFQQDLARRIKAADADSGAQVRLAFEAAGHSWLLGLAEAGEVLRVPDIERVPLTRAWFAGVANLRGVLYGVTDFSSFLGGVPAPRGDASRLLLIGQPHGINAALLVERLSGLRNVAEFEPAEDRTADEFPWMAQVLREPGGKLWRTLDAARLLSTRDFLEIALQ